MAANDNLDKRLTLGRDLICHYTWQGFQYQKILEMLSKFCHRQMSNATLKRCIKPYGLRWWKLDFDFNTICKKISEFIGGTKWIVGYCHVWCTRQRQGFRVPCLTAQDMLRELDPEGTIKRTYHNLGPNYAWHCDSYDKLKLCFPLHGCSCKILWVYITQTNNSPHNICTWSLILVPKMEWWLQRNVFSWWPK